MKLITLLLFVIATPVFAQLKWDNAQQTFAPRLGEKVATAKYRFTNIGTSTVTITDVTTSCGCTTATLTKKEYASGESGEIEATFNFAGHVGHQGKWIFVTTSFAPKEPVLLSLAVDVPADVMIQPDFVMWGIGDKLETKTMRVLIPDGISAKVVSVKSDNSAVKIDLREVRPGKEFEIAVTPTNTNQPLKSTLSVRTDYPPENPATFSAYARVQ